MWTLHYSTNLLSFSIPFIILNFSWEYSTRKYIQVGSKMLTQLGATTKIHVLMRTSFLLVKTPVRQQKDSLWSDVKRTSSIDVLILFNIRFKNFLLLSCLHISHKNIQLTNNMKVEKRENQEKITSVIFLSKFALKNENKSSMKLHGWYHLFKKRSDFILVMAETIKIKSTKKTIWMRHFCIISQYIDCLIYWTYKRISSNVIWNAHDFRELIKVKLTSDKL